MTAYLLRDRVAYLGGEGSLARGPENEMSASKDIRTSSGFIIDGIFLLFLLFFLLFFLVLGSVLKFG